MPIVLNTGSRKAIWCERMGRGPISKLQRYLIFAMERKLRFRGQDRSTSNTFLACANTATTRILNLSIEHTRSSLPECWIITKTCSLESGSLISLRCTEAIEKTSSAIFISILLNLSDAGWLMLELRCLRTCSTSLIKKYFIQG